MNVVIIGDRPILFPPCRLVRSTPNVVMSEPADVTGESDVFLFAILEISVYQFMIMMIWKRMCTYLINIYYHTKKLCRNFFLYKSDANTFLLLPTHAKSYFGDVEQFIFTQFYALNTFRVSNLYLQQARLNQLIFNQLTL